MYTTVFYSGRKILPAWKVIDFLSIADKPTPQHIPDTDVFTALQPRCRQEGIVQIVARCPTGRKSLGFFSRARILQPHLDRRAGDYLIGSEAFTVSVKGASNTRIRLSHAWGP